MFGLAGGFAGQFVVGPMIASGVSWSSLMTVSGGPAQKTLEHYQTTFTAFLYRRRARHRSRTSLERDGTRGPTAGPAVRNHTP